ncbi:MAG: tetratricopeptide repeat protein [Sphingomonadales bacterium]|jgi:tetratricopeptide (TPR) repeat protein|uniref:tetratricopeptide repeat protein n=4 Tax=Sphingorhabdus sp. TaxID=1902408 RepID=UPI003BB042AD|nr:tetratricopeptide repeat protein [Sphingomonadales bacterium]MBL0022172.1 tetratricopeptide repeat protein [Sphingomonadales bacterium]
MIFRLTATVSLLALSVSAKAGSNILYETPQSWIEQVDLSQVLKQKPDSKNFIVVLDKQAKFEHGVQHSYFDLVFRIQSAELLTQMGSLLSAQWHPDRGDMIVHRLEILRNGETIDALKNGTKFEVLRREAGLGQNQINGILTGTAQITGLQLGDLVRFSVTTSAANAALDGRAESLSLIPTAEIGTDFNRLRTIWPKSEHLNYKLFGEKIASELTEKDGYSVLIVPAIAPKQTEMPEDAPHRFKVKPNLMVTQFTDWKDVSRATAKLYKTDSLIAADSALAAEVGRIASATSDPKVRTAMAVRLVQDKIRYLFNGLGFGNYVPQTPQQTWELRYGDCKAKTLLLLAILNELDIDAQPVLVNASVKDAATVMTPGFFVFDHILVRARVGQRTFWLDGTDTGTRINDLEDIPPHRYGLPVTAEGAELEELGIAKPGRPLKEVRLTYDLSAGLVLPAFFDMQLKLRDEDARNLRASQTQNNAKVFKEELNTVAGKYIVEGIVTESSFVYDEEKSEAVITAKGISYLDWSKKDGASNLDIWSVIDGKEIKADRKKREWRAIPLDLGSGWSYQEKAEFILPKTQSSFQLKGLATISEAIAGHHLDRNTELGDGKVVFSENYYLKQWELPTSEIAPEIRKLTRVQDEDVKIVAPSEYPEEWIELVDVLKGRKLNDYKMAFDSVVAMNPDKDIPYRQRAYFYDLIGDVAKAEKDLAAALKIESTADTLNWRADLLRQSDVDTSISLLQEAVKAEPDHYSSIETLAEIHAMAGRTKEAEAVIDAAYNAGLGDDDVDTLKSYIALLSGDSSKAMELLDQMVEKNPEDAGVLGTRCWHRALSKTELEAALEDCTKSIELSENPSGTLDSRGLVYLQLGRIDEAISDYDAALALSPEQASSYYQRSIANARAGRKAESDNDLAAALFYSRNVGLLFEKFGIKR